MGTRKEKFMSMVQNKEKSKILDLDMSMYYKN